MVINSAGKGNDSMQSVIYTPQWVPGRALPWVDYKTRKEGFPLVDPCLVHFRPWSAWAWIWGLWILMRTWFTDRCAMLSYADALRVTSPWNKVFKPLIDFANVYPRVWVMNEIGWYEIILCLPPIITPNCYGLVCLLICLPVMFNPDVARGKIFRLTGWILGMGKVRNWDTRVG